MVPGSVANVRDDGVFDAAVMFEPFRKRKKPEKKEDWTQGKNISTDRIEMQKVLERMPVLLTKSLSRGHRRLPLFFR